MKFSQHKNEVKYHKIFHKCLSDLPASVQEQAAKVYALWREDPYHPSLQGMTGGYS